MASLELTNKWHFSALLFNKLFSNYSNKCFDAFSKDAITPKMSSAMPYGVLSSAWCAILASLKMKNKYGINNNGPSVEHCGTPKIVSSQEL